MAAAWGGRTPGGNRAPRIAALAFAETDVIAVGREITAKLDANDPDGDPLTVEWQVMEEQKMLRKAGDAEPELRRFPEAIRLATQDTATLGGLAPGAYRLYVTVRDGKGAAAAGNLPFRVE